jgi:drug/metabolite transporter (DMT)-like permease
MLLLAVLCWAVSFPVAKLAMDDWHNYKFFFLAGRFWLAFTIFALWITRRREWQKLSDHAKPGFIMGITLVTALGLQYTAFTLGSSSGVVAFITALSAVLVPVGVGVALRRRVKARIWFGLIIATGGVILVNKGSFFIDRAGWLAFLSAIGLAVYIILVGYFMNQKRCSLFDLNDFEDLTTFAVKLRDGQDNLSQYLRTQFTSSTQQSLNSYNSSGLLPASLQESLIEELNNRLIDPSFFEEQRFAHIELTEEIKVLIAQNPKGEELNRLNRILIAEAYPKEIIQHKYEKVPFLTVQFLTLATAATLLSLLTEIPNRGMPEWSNNAIFGMVFMSIVATAGALHIQTKYQPMTSPERAALVFTLEAPFAALFGYMLLGETFTFLMTIGAVMILVGIAIAEILEARKPPDPPRAVSIDGPKDPSGPAISGSTISSPRISEA